MAMRAAPKKATHPKAASPAAKKSATAPAANKKPAAARKVAAPAAARPAGDADLATQFTATLQSVRQRNKQLTTELNALLAAMK